MSKLARYNLGFGAFGPLEQCSEGKLMKASEVVPYVERLQARLAVLHTECHDLRLDAIKDMESKLDLIEENKKLLKWLTGLIVLLVYSLVFSLVWRLLQ